VSKYSTISLALKKKPMSENFLRPSVGGLTNYPYMANRAHDTPLVHAVHPYCAHFHAYEIIFWQIIEVLRGIAKFHTVFLVLCTSSLPRRTLMTNFPAITKGWVQCFIAKYPALEVCFHCRTTNYSGRGTVCFGCGTVWFGCGTVWFGCGTIWLGRVPNSL